MPRIRLDFAGVTATAMAVVDDRGFDALSLSAVAELLGVGASALYSHVDGLEGLREAVAVESTRGLTGAVRNAAIGTAGDDAIRAVAHAYRAFAQTHPGRFASTIRVQSSGLSIEQARQELDSVFLLLSLARGLSEAHAGAAARTARSAIHGFLVLQHTGAGGTDSDYAALIEVLCASVTPQG